MKTTRILALLLFLFALPLRAQLVFDQNPQASRVHNWWVVSASTSELACLGWKDRPIPCTLWVVARTNPNDHFVMIDIDDPGTTTVWHGTRPRTLFDTTPTMPALPWTEGPIAFSGTWERAHGFDACGYEHYHPCCTIPDLTISVDESYSGSIDFDSLDGEGNPVNLSVSFTLSEP